MTTKDFIAILERIRQMAVDTQSLETTIRYINDYIERIEEHL